MKTIVAECGSIIAIEEVAKISATEDDLSTILTTCDKSYFFAAPREHLSVSIANLRDEQFLQTWGGRIQTTDREKAAWIAEQKKVA